MGKIELDVLFKKMQKDDKKEVLEFHFLGDELPYQSELIGMAGSISILNIGEVTLSAEFKSIQRDSKKVVLKFEVKGDNEDEMVTLYSQAGYNISLLLEQSQMTIDDFHEESGDPGLEYSVEQGGTVEVVQGQMSTEDIPTGEPDNVNFDDDDLLN